MNRSEAMAFLKAADAPGIRPGLSRVRELLKLLGDPQDQLRCIHIAGTNGKGSAAVMLESILREAGYRTGLFTSPFLVHYHEQIRIDGEEISDEELFAALTRVKDAAQEMEEAPSSFERFMPAAFLCFAEAACDIAILETGMGGRLDATNVITAPEAAIIMRIAMDHMDFLGSTIEEIAGEKAGIIKPDTDVIMIRQPDPVLRVIRRKCEETGARLYLTDPDGLTSHGRGLEGQRFDYRLRKDLTLPIPAVYQLENAAVVLDAVDVLKNKGWKIREEAVRSGLAGVKWPGRFEILGKKPLVILDGAHNPDGAAALAESLQGILPGGKAVFVMGVLADKDYRTMIDLFAPFAERFITTAPDNPRALSAEALAAEIRLRTDVPAECGGTMAESLKKAADCIDEEGAVCICGTLYQAGEARAWFSASDKQIAKNES